MDEMNMEIEEYLVKDAPSYMEFEIPDGFRHITYYAERDEEGMWEVCRSRFLGRDEYIATCWDREEVYSAVLRDADF